jgi:hypothetical protein
MGRAPQGEEGSSGGSLECRWLIVPNAPSEFVAEAEEQVASLAKPWAWRRVVWSTSCGIASFTGHQNTVLDGDTLMRTRLNGAAAVLSTRRGAGDEFVVEHLHICRGVSWRSVVATEWHL